MVFCSSCGTSLIEGARFCPSCGANTVNNTQANAKSNNNTNTSTSKPAVESQYNSINNKSSILNSGIKPSELHPIVDELKKFYRNKILPLEQAFKFEDFHSPSLTDTDFDAKPIVLLVGQYSTGNTYYYIYSI